MIDPQTPASPLPRISPSTSKANWAAIAAAAGTILIQVLSKLIGAAPPFDEATLQQSIIILGMALLTAAGTWIVTWLSPPNELSKPTAPTP